MKHYFFELCGGIDLPDEFKTGFHFYSVICDKFARPFAIYLIRPNGSFLSFKSFVYDVGPRVEVGSLRIERGSEIGLQETPKSLPEEFHKGVRYFSLNIKIECCEIESGIAIVSESGEELAIYPGEMPFSIHVRSKFFTDNFKPEFILSDYVRIDPKL